jgi:hypothetical protein
VKRSGPPQRRTRLARGNSQLKRTEFRRTPGRRGFTAKVPAAKAVKTQRRKDQDPGEFTAAVKLACRTRAGGGEADDACCESCGHWLGRLGGVIQHRRARKSGGCRLRLINSVQNAALQCWPCNDVAEARDDHMNAMGFWLKNGQQPDMTSIMHHGADGGRVVWLAADGTYADGPPAERRVAA